MPDPTDFESRLQRLESLVVKLEQGDLPLADALSAYEEGVNITRACQKQLNEAEQKIELLSKGSKAKSDDE
ncbi:exodeoxyribonuclease VII small subunit [Salinibius halmophilus]|uniref:exodeoxyribonuclease VII small subunit n=1 Tax=Salinibius halmophilus TaxID=1853216 RepID=UPI000E666389|nr:exodeoxyribonuclease VII small subunit [Salinibius halmophilus]